MLREIDARSRPLRLVTIALLLCCSLPASAQKRSSAAHGINVLAAPVPTPLVEGKRAFISYELGDVSSFPSRYSGGPERAYSELYAAMKAWGRYELVLDPSQADVIFAIRFVDPPELPTPQIRLGISDAKTRAPLWGFVEQVDFAFRKKNRDLAFSETVDQLVSDVETLLVPPAPAPAQPPAP
jgi:hypothetical protein